MIVSTPTSTYARGVATQLRTFADDLPALASAGIVTPHRNALVGTDAGAPLKQLHRALSMMGHTDNAAFADRAKQQAPAALRDAIAAADAVGRAGNATPIPREHRIFERIGEAMPEPRSTRTRAGGPGFDDRTGFRTSKPGEPFGASIPDEVRYADTGGVRPTFNGFVNSFVADLKDTRTMQAAEGRVAQAKAGWRSFLGG